MTSFSKIKNLRTRIKNNKERVTEEDVRLALNSEIENCLLNKFNKEIHFKAEKKLISNSRRIDSAYGNLIIEYKKPTVNIGDTELKQIIEYMEDFAKLGNREEIWGILTNGIEIKYIEYKKNNRRYDIVQNRSGKLTNDKIEDLCRDIAEIKKITLNKRNINDYLGLENNKRIKCIVNMLLNKVIKSKNSRTKLLYNEWERLTRLSSDKDSWNEDKGKNKKINDFYKDLYNREIKDNQMQYKCLFVVQTYYAIVVKLILFKYLKKKFNESFNNYDLKQELFKEIESTRFYKEHNILNLIDGDFYSWYLYELKEKEYISIFSLVEDVETIDTNSLNDTLISFYENIFPFEVRYAMGEYYTPNYLAKEVIDNAFKIVGNDNVSSVLDPTCGSGIFISTIYKSNYNKKIYGIDINPLAVLTAKASLVLNDFDINKETEIPIYLGDSTYSPKQDIVNGVECYSYDYLTFIGDLTINVTLPIDLIKETNFFEILDILENAIKNKNKKMAMKIIESFKSSHFKELKDCYKRLFEQLIDLENKKMNSIWLKIIGNYFKAASIKNIDLIVGNPPWVRWSNLPTNYKNEVKKKCKVKGLFSEDKNTGGVDLNIAALIAFICISDRLSKKGVLGFLLPDSILTNKSFEGFRKMELDDGRKFYLHKVIRWNGAEKPFKPVSIEFGEFFFSFKKNKKVDVFDKKTNKKYRMIKSSGGFNNHYIKESIVNSAKKFIGTNKLNFRSGIGLPKAGHFLLEFNKVVNNKLIQCYPYEKVGGSLKKSNRLITIENDIVYPFIKSELINNNEIKKTNYYCIFPYPNNSKQPYSLEEIKEKFPYFYKYLNRSSVQESISTASTYNKRIQNVENDLGIIRVGLYTYGKYFLACRDNTKASIAKLSYIKTEWGDKKLPIFDGHINYISMNEKGEFLSKKEVNNLFKVFSKKEVQDYIFNSADSRSISARLWNSIKLE
ncbi:MAG: hypothetical protein J6M39_07935 [Lachnospiraceae bacterium]|nr:hypothetical protein [Lachnospiraceae bacterium]